MGYKIEVTMYPWERDLLDEEFGKRDEEGKLKEIDIETLVNRIIEITAVRLKNKKGIES